MISQVLNKLNLPSSCLVDQKLPKTFFKRNFDLTLSEKKLLDDYSIIKQLEILALVNPETANIPSFNDGAVSYEEIIILAVETSNEQLDKQKNKIIELIQKYIPNPVVLLIYDEQRMIINVAEKRINSNDATKRVLEKNYLTDTITIQTANKKQLQFIENIAFDKANKLNLNHYYNHFIQSVIGLQTAQISGTFVARPLDQSKENVLLLEQIEALRQKIITFENLAKKETQIPEMVKYNTIMQEYRNEIINLTDKITNQ